MICRQPLVSNCFWIEVRAYLGWGTYWKPQTTFMCVLEPQYKEGRFWDDSRVCYFREWPSQQGQGCWRVVGDVILESIVWEDLFRREPLNINGRKELAKGKGGDRGVSLPLPKTGQGFWGSLDRCILKIEHPDGGSIVGRRENQVLDCSPGLFRPW